MIQWDALERKRLRTELFFITVTAQSHILQVRDLNNDIKRVFIGLN